MTVCKRILSASSTQREVPTGEFWNLAFDSAVLGQLCQLREELIRDCSSDARRVLRAILLGALHGPIGKQSNSYFSNQCPRTFSPKPAYAVRFWRDRGLRFKNERRDFCLVALRRLLLAWCWGTAPMVTFSRVVDLIGRSLPHPTMECELTFRISGCEIGSWADLPQWSIRRPLVK